MLISLIRERIGVTGLVIIFFVLELLTMVFGVHSMSVFGPFWTFLAIYAYVDKFGNWMSQQILTWVKSVSETAAKTVVSSTLIVSNSLQDLGTTLTTGTTMSGLLNNFSKHKIGVTLCAKTALAAETPLQIVEETCKVASMLGLEHSIVSSAVGRISSLSGGALQQLVEEHVDVVEEHFLEDIEKYIPLVSTVAAVADCEITEMNISNKMDKIARNMKSAEVITQQVRKVCEAAGIIKPVNFSVIEELNTSVSGLKQDYQWIVETLATRGSDFNNPNNYRRVTHFKEKVTAISNRLRSIDIPAIRNNQIITECNQIISKSLDYLNQISIIRENTGFRIVPVGVCFQGPSHCGKSSLQPIFTQMVKDRLMPHRDKFGEVEHWSTWTANQRDEFDSGYDGHEITAMDDAFQDKTNKDHLMWYTYVSPTCVGTMQGIAERKGLPYRSFLAIVTCNQLPKTSITVNHIEALHNRFPITVRVHKKSEMPKEFDPTFAHLGMRVNTMSKWVSEVDTDKSPEVTLDQLADMVVKQMLKEYDHFEHKMRMLKVVPLAENGDYDDFLSSLDDLPDDPLADSLFEEEESDHESESSSEGEESAGSNPVDSSEPFIRHVILETIPEEDIELEQPEPQAVLWRYQNTRTTGTVNSEMDWASIGRRLNNDLQTVAKMEHSHSIHHVRSWTRFLKKQTSTGWETVNREDYSGEDGLYVFLASLGSWMLDAEHFDDFSKEYWSQPLLNIEGPLGDRYIWGPRLDRGRVLYLVSPSMIAGLELELQNFFVKAMRKGQAGAKRFVQSLLDSNAHRFWLRQAVVIPVSNAMGILPMVATARVYAIVSNEMNQVPYVMSWTRYSRWNPINLALRSVSVLNFPIIFASRGFEYLDRITERLRSGMKGILLRCLEYLGVDTTSFWTEVADLASAALNDIITLGLAGLILVLLYRLVKLLFKSNTIEEHSKNEGGKGSKKQKKKEEKLKRTTRVKALQLHGAEKELVCQSVCKDENVLLVSDEKEWIKFGPCVSKDTIYETDYLEHIMDKIDDEAYVVKAICFKQTHCALTMEECDDFTVEQNRFVGAWKKSEVLENREIPVMEISMEFSGLLEEVFTVYKEWMSRFKAKKICDWRGEICARFSDPDRTIVHLKICLVCLNTNIQGTPGRFLNAHLKDLKLIADDIRGIKKVSEKKIEEILDPVLEEHGIDEAFSLVTYLQSNHSVFLSKVPPELLDSEQTGVSTHGNGSRNIIIFNAHCFDKGDIVRFWRYPEKKNKTYGVCLVESRDPVRDVGIARIISRKRLYEILWGLQIRVMPVRVNTVQDSFRSLKQHLCDKKNWYELSNDKSTLNFLPSAGGITKGRVSIIPIRSYEIGGKTQSREYIEITDLNGSCELSRRGDCGGVIVSCHNRYQSKMIGFHAGTTGTTWCGAILRQEDLQEFEEHGDKDSWEDLITKGEPTDLPFGPEVQFLGKYISTTMPVSSKTNRKWMSTPWVEEFEEQLQPSVLDPYDSRITTDLPENLNGKKSLLLVPNSKMCESLPPMKEDILLDIENQMVIEASLKLGFMQTVPEDVDEAIKLGLNGNSDNVCVTNLDISKACGEPWNKLPGVSKKSDLLYNEEGFIGIREDRKGLVLKLRLKQKLLQARRGVRMLSFSNSKLKDELVKIAKVLKGETRVFHCIPVEKIICDAALFGNFKESFCKAFLDMNHAIGVNPHSIGWKAIYKHLDKHPNVFDMDFGNYDKRLQAVLLATAFRIIRRTIQIMAPDGWDLAREVLQDEAINTFVIDYDTVYQTKRGNKSGEYLTTVINCICNDILSYYAWIELTNIRELSTFRENVSIVTFGDDKCESVSDEFADLYNYETVKVIMNSIGHVITPGNKDGIESKFCGMSKLQFLKRTFVELDGAIIAPLSTRSIESPFVWTQTDSTEIVIWKNLIEQSLYEAFLHGEEYYTDFCTKLGKCSDLHLRSQIAALLTLSYNQIASKYFRVWYGTTTHLIDE